MYCSSPSLSGLNLQDSQRAGNSSEDVFILLDRKYLYFTVFAVGNTSWPMFDLGPFLLRLVDPAVGATANETNHIVVVTYVSLIRVWRSHASFLEIS